MPGKKRLSVLASVATVAALAGCGSSDINGSVSPEDANTLKTDLAGVQQAAAIQDCGALTTRARGFLDAVNALPATAGTDLKNALRESANHLMTLANEQCASGATGPTGHTSTSSTTTSAPPTSSPTTTRSTTTSTTSTKEQPPPQPGGGGNPNGGGNPGGGGGSGGGVGGGTGGTGGTGDGSGGGG